MASARLRPAAKSAWGTVTQTHTRQKQGGFIILAEAACSLKPRVKEISFATHTTRKKMNRADDLFERISHDSEKETPMAALVIRFSGEKLAHVGNAMFSAVELALAQTDKDVAYRGWLMIGPEQSARNAKPAKGAGLKALREALATQQKMPARTPAEANEQTGTTAFCLHFKDGDPRSITPESFGLYFSLLDDPKESFATTKGFLMLGLPLASLEDPAKWFQVAEKMISILQAEVAWLGPALWLIPQHLCNVHFSDSPHSLIPLFGRTPQVDVPSLYASRWPFPTNEGEFDPFSGFLAPAWTLWAHAPLAEKIKSFPGSRTVLPEGHVRFQLSEQVPFEMTDSLYTEWKTNWQALSPLHVTPGYDAGEISTYFKGRFSAESFSTLEPKWQQEHEAEEARKQHQHQLYLNLKKMDEPPTLELLAEAGKLNGQISAESMAWVIMPALAILTKEKRVPSDLIEHWLDFALQNIEAVRSETLIEAAATASMAGFPERAMEFLRHANWASEAHILKSIKKDRRFKLLDGNVELQSLLSSFLPVKTKNK